MRTNNVSPNVKLRAAREGRSLSQEQVAELVADEVERHRGRRPPIDADQVSRYERGLHRWPGRDYRLAFRQVFGVTTDAELGFYSGRSRGRVQSVEAPTTLERRASTEPSRLPPGIDPVDRRFFLMGIGALGVEVAAGTRIGSGDVKQLRQALTSFKSLDNRVGGDRLHESAAVHLRDVSRLINTCKFGESTGRKLRAAAGDLAIFTGWLAFDAERHAESWYYFNEGLTAARLADDAGIEVHALAQRSLLAGRLGRPRDAVELAQQARTVAEGQHMSNRLRSLLHLREARGWSELDETSAARRSLTSGHKLFDRGPSDRDPAWISFYDGAELDGLTGLCLAELAAYDRAAEMTAAGLAQIQPQYVRNRAFYTTTYAQACADAGRPDEAAQAGTQALVLLDEVSSARTVNHLRALYRALVAKYQKLAVVRDFDGQYRSSGVA